MVFWFYCYVAEGKQNILAGGCSGAKLSSDSAPLTGLRLVTVHSAMHRVSVAPS